jgi:hypothetical protein
MEDEFYELCYETWMTGKNPDLVDIDRYDDARADGYYPDEITLKMVYPLPPQEDE